jgi:hypothetical protein
MWFYPITLLNAFDTLLGQGQTGQDFDLLLNTGGGAIAFFFNSGGHSVASAVNIPAGKWYHVVVTGRCITGSTSLSLYLNGVLSGTSSDGNTRNTAAINMYLAGTPSYTRPANVVLDDIRIYNRVLTADEAYRMYRQPSEQYNGFINKIGVPFSLPAPVTGGYWAVQQSDGVGFGSVIVG